VILTISIDFSNYNPNSQNPRMPASGEESAGGARRRMNNPGFIFSAYIMNPDANGPARAFSFSRHARGASPEDVRNSNFFSSFGVFNALFQELVGDIFNQESFMTNFNSNFRSNDIFQEVINRSAQEAQEAAKKPTTKEARKKLAVVKISKKHCKKVKGKALEAPSCTV